MSGWLAVHLQSTWIQQPLSIDQLVRPQDVQRGRAKSLERLPSIRHLLSHKTIIIANSYFYPVPSISTRQKVNEQESKRRPLLKSQIDNISHLSPLLQKRFQHCLKVVLSLKPHLPEMNNLNMQMALDRTVMGTARLSLLLLANVLEIVGGKNILSDSPGLSSMILNQFFNSLILWKYTF